MFIVYLSGRLLDMYSMGLKLVHTVTIPGSDSVMLEVQCLLGESSTHRGVI